MLAFTYIAYCLPGFCWEQAGIEDLTAKISSRTRMEKLLLQFALLGMTLANPVVVEFDCSNQQGVIWWGCGAYGVCQGGQYSQVDCVNGTVYDRQAQQCASAGLGNVAYPCGKPPADCSAYAQNPGHRIPDMDVDTFENRPPCSYYYTCAYGFFLGYQTCPQRTVYDEEDQRCKQPEMVPPPCGNGPPRDNRGHVGGSGQYGGQNSNQYVSQISNQFGSPNTPFGGQNNNQLGGQNGNQRGGQNQHGGQNPNQPFGQQTPNTEREQSGQLGSHDNNGYNNNGNNFNNNNNNLNGQNQGGRPSGQQQPTNMIKNNNDPWVDPWVDSPVGNNINNNNNNNECMCTCAHHKPDMAQRGRWKRSVDDP